MRNLHEWGVRYRHVEVRRLRGLGVGRGKLGRGVVLRVGWL